MKSEETKAEETVAKGRRAGVSASWSGIQWWGAAAVAFCLLAVEIERVLLGVVGYSYLVLEMKL